MASPGTGWQHVAIVVRMPFSPRTSTRGVGCTVGIRGIVRRSAPGVSRFSAIRSEEHTSELQSPVHLVCRLLLEKKKQKNQFLPLLFQLFLFCFTHPLVYALIWRAHIP